MHNQATVTLRWIAVLPAAFIAYFVVHWLLMLIGKISGSEIIFANLSITLLSPIAFMYVGAKTAPSKRYLTAIVLAALYALLQITAFVFVMTGVVNSSLEQRLVWRLWLVRSAASIAVTVFYCIGMKKSHRA